VHELVHQREVVQFERMKREMKNLTPNVECYSSQRWKPSGVDFDLSVLRSAAEKQNYSLF